MSPGRWTRQVTLAITGTVVEGRAIHPLSRNCSPGVDFLVFLIQTVVSELFQHKHSGRESFGVEGEMRREGESKGKEGEEHFGSWCEPRTVVNLSQSQN